MSAILPPCKECDRKGCGAYHDQCEAYQEFLRLNAEKRKAEIDEHTKNCRPVSKRPKKDMIWGDYR